MSKAEVILESTKKADYKNAHLDNLDKKYLVDNNKNTKMINVKHIIPISSFSINKCITFN